MDSRMTSGDQKILVSSLGFDHRFKYPNVQINEDYHIIKTAKPYRTVKDFNPTTKEGSGSVGHNFLLLSDMGDHMIVPSYKPRDSRGFKFAPLDKKDRPFSKNTHKM